MSALDPRRRRPENPLSSRDSTGRERRIAPMKPFTLVPAVVLFLFVTAVSLASANQTYMEITFDDKAIGQPIGIGGATMGEPDWVDTEIEAIVRATPFPSRSLEIHSVDYQNPHNLGFMLPSLAVSSGLVVIIMDLWFEEEGSDAEPWIDFYKSSWSYLAKLYFESGGTIRIWDANGTIDGPTFPKGSALPVLVAFDMDAGTYSVWIDETPVVVDRLHGLADPNFSHLVFNTGYEDDQANRFWIDQIRVLDWLPGNIAVEPATWGRIRALYR
jgi:hypothetical protein